MNMKEPHNEAVIVTSVTSLYVSKIIGKSIDEAQIGRHICTCLHVVWHHLDCLHRRYQLHLFRDG